MMQKSVGRIKIFMVFPLPLKVILFLIRCLCVYVENWTQGPAPVKHVLCLWAAPETLFRFYKIISMHGKEFQTVEREVKGECFLLFFFLSVFIFTS